LHERSAAVLQGYVRYQDSAAFNVGVGRVQDMKSQQLLNDALARAGAEQLVQRLPHGISTQLDGTGSGPRHIPGLPQHEHGRHGLSGGEWQRIAIARAFMRASRPDVDLLLLDEPTSALDGHAQNAVFQTIEQLSRSPTGERTKTVVFITHRLATARRADRILMLEHGVSRSHADT
jgi:ABC-type multidrug transport system fused ATPase/permease subunit